MSHISQAQAGLTAVENKNWDAAVANLSAALKVSQNPAWLVARSKALAGLKRYQASLDDADLAWHAAYERSKRNVLADAQYRRAVAYHRLGQFANADACCIYTMRLIKGMPAVEKVDPAAERTDDNGFYTVTLAQAKEEDLKDKLNEPQNVQGVVGGGSSSLPAQIREWRAASTMRTQILYALEKLPIDDPARKLTTSLKPERKDLVDHSAKKQTQPPKPVVAVPKEVQPVASNTAATPQPQTLRFQEFQNNTHMTVSIFSKGNNKEKLQVHYLLSAVILDSIVYPGGKEDKFRLNLWGEIDTEGSKCTVTPNKVELSLKKKTPGKWAQLESDKKEESSDEAAAKEKAELEFLKEARKKAMQAAEDSAKSTPSEDKVENKEKAAPKPTAPAYPTSSKSGAKNWDAIAADEDDENDGSDVNLFFKRLYKDATPDQQRAMMKSFTESNGTSLSTSWESVKDGKVETVPPPGVEAKPYNS